jgi:hypothetical protein
MWALPPGTCSSSTVALTSCPSTEAVPLGRRLLQNVCGHTIHVVPPLSEASRERKCLQARLGRISLLERLTDRRIHVTTSIPFDRLALYFQAPHIFPAHLLTNLLT